MRMCVIKNRDNTVSCIPVTCSKEYYDEKFEVLCFVNKTWNPYYVNSIKKYFEAKGFVKKDSFIDFNEILYNT